MMIPKIPSSIDYNFWLKRFNTQLNESSNQSLLKVSKVVNTMKKKTLLKTLGTSVIKLNSQLFPSFLISHSHREDQRFI